MTGPRRTFLHALMHRRATQRDVAARWDADARGAESAPEPNGSGTLWLLREALARHPGKMLGVLVAAAVSNALMLVQPLFIMTVYDRVIPHGAFETLWALAIGVLMALALDYFVRGARNRLEIAVAIDISLDLQARLYRRLMHARMAQTPRAVSDWTNAFRELDAGSAIVPPLWAAVLIDLPFICAILVVVFGIAGNIVLAPVLGMVVFGLWTFFGMLAMRGTGAQVADSLNQRTELLTESASLVSTARAAGLQDRLTHRFETLLAGSVRPSDRLRSHTALQPRLTNLTVQAVAVAAVVIGVYRIDAGQMTVGALVAAMLFVTRLLMPAGQIVVLVTRASEVSRPLMRVQALMRLPQEQAGDTSVSRQVAAGELRLTGVAFAFEGCARRALDGVSLRIAPGEKVALIGRSGSGKSTLLQLLVRLYDPDEGAYLIDGFDARQFAPRTLRQSMAYMAQETDLFDGSLYDNLVGADPSIDETRLQAALTAAGADGFVRQAPDGLSLRVGKRGGQLSGGERQAIGLARTLLLPSRILLLDEPTSAMDQTMERQVIAGLKALPPDRGLIVATHRVSVLSAVDRVIWMDGGRVVADGPRDAVLAKLNQAA